MTERRFLDNGAKIEILDEKWLSENGQLLIERYLRGNHPELGRVILGWTGVETIQRFEPEEYVAEWQQAQIIIEGKPTNGLY